MLRLADLREKFIATAAMVLADDHQQMIATMRQTIEEEFEVVGAAEDGKQAVNAVLALHGSVLSKCQIGST
jgi:DNA-binding NarL/FixJ family response regulator